MASIRLQIAQLIDHPQEWVNTLWKGLVLKITKSTDTFLCLWSDQFAIEVDIFYRKFSKFSKSAIQSVDFNRKLLSSQTTHQNVPVFFGILRTRTFHRALTHFCELSVSWESSREIMCGIPPPCDIGENFTPRQIGLTSFS